MQGNLAFRLNDHHLDEQGLLAAVTGGGLFRLDRRRRRTYQFKRSARGMLLAVASGKGGTGKTTVAVALAASAPGPVTLLDCDVEEPNCHIFLRPEISRRESVGLAIPSVDEGRCNACGECGRMCQYHAIVSLKTKPLIFPDLCHGCGGCVKVCPTGAITEVEHEIGAVEIGACGAVRFVEGRLNIGQPMSPPLIRAVKRHAGADGLTIIDCPPGTSCPVVAAVRGSDFVLLVTEPTPFGLHDLTLAVETVQALGIPFGVIINRADAGDGRVLDYCRNADIPVLLQIPDDRRIAEAYTRGEGLLDASPGLWEAFEGLHAAVARRAREHPSTSKPETR